MRILWTQRESEYVRDLIASPAATIELVKMGETSLSENQSNALLSFSMPVADEHTNKTAISKVYDLTLPEPESLAANPKGMSVFWMSRHQWMFEQPYLVDPDWVLNTPLRQYGCVTEQTDAWVRFDLAGPRLSLILCRLANVSQNRYEPGAAIRSVIHHLGVYLVCSDKSKIAVYGPRSSADTLAEALVSSICTANGLIKRK